MVQSIGYEPEEPCECTPLSSRGAVIFPAVVVGERINHPVRIVGTTPRITATPFKPSWLSISVTKDGILFSGVPPDTTKISGVVQLRNECSAGIIVQYSGQAKPKCVPNVDITRDLYSANTFVQELVTVAPDSVIVEPVVLPSGMSANMFDSGLSISGTPSPSTVFPFHYGVNLASACGDFELRGFITTADKPADCLLPTVTGYTGTPLFEEGVKNTYCMKYSGTKVRIDELPELPVGLVWDQTTPGTICVTGTLLKDVCSKEATAACVSLLLLLENECGALKTYMSLQSVNVSASRPSFCAGVVMLTQETSPAAGVSRWSVAARYFPVGSILTLSLVALSAGGAAIIILGTTKEITITSDNMTDVFDAQVSGSGCASAFVQASHPTCAVMTNIAAATPMFQILNDCNVVSVGNP